MTVRLLAAAVALLLLAGCDPVPAQPGPAMGLFWQGAAEWSVNREPFEGGFYCSATRGIFSPDFALNEVPSGAVGWNVTDTTRRAVPDKTYPVTLHFEPGGELRFDAYLQSPTRLASLPADPSKTAALARDVAGANAVALSSPLLGPFGRFSLAGANEALVQLDRCAHGAL